MHNLIRQISMKTSAFPRIAIAVMTTGFALLNAGQAAASLSTQMYSIIIKDARGGIMTCPSNPSELTFSDLHLDSTGYFTPSTSPAPSITLCTGLNDALLPFTFDTHDTLQLSVVDAGGNIAGMQGRMTGSKTLNNGNTAKLAIDFTAVWANGSGTFTPTYSINLMPDTDPERQIALGSYQLTNLHVANPQVANLSVIPEPGTLALLAAGIVGLMFLARRLDVKDLPTHLTRGRMS
jgi:hypothetical protein